MSNDRRVANASPMLFECMEDSWWKDGNMIARCESQIVSYRYTPFPTQLNAQASARSRREYVA